MLTGCVGLPRTTTKLTETEKVICKAWLENLPLKSRKDPAERQEVFNQHYADYEATCGELGVPLVFRRMSNGT